MSVERDDVVIKQEELDDATLLMDLGTGDVTSEEEPVILCGNGFKRLKAFCCVAVDQLSNYWKTTAGLVWILVVALFVVWSAFARISCYVAPGHGFFLTHARPLCSLPLRPIGCLCSSPFRADASGLAADFRSLMKIEGDSLQALMGESKSMSIAAWDFMSLEISTPQLIRLVEASDFTSKLLLIQHLQHSQVRSRSSSETMDRLGRHIHFCADSTVSVNDFAMRTVANDRVTLFGYFFTSPSTTHRPVAQESFEISLDTFATCIGQAAILGRDATVEFNAFGHELDVINDINSREGQAILRYQDRVRGSLWTWLGGNAGNLRRAEDGLLLVALISNFHSKGSSYVNNTMFAIATINDKVFELRNAAVATHPPYSALTLEPLQAQLHYIELNLMRVTQQIVDNQDHLFDARNRAFARAGIAN
ncbi:hypothetical protein BDY19DRAFT_998745 [Irpex rosettiformis]|uniref:Uncharacterized protein n=1 Tax=Irpex rosettiformis TaxID=378272 RepID=A0ACB8TMQ5_9APHY|nr:hypothetical protein BDY19DRAFT_998745 [Irpex rosettiformis]